MGGCEDGLDPKDQDFMRFAASIDEECPGFCRRVWHWLKFLPVLFLLVPVRFIMLWVLLFLIWVISKVSEGCVCGCCTCCSRRSSGGMAPQKSIHMIPHTWIQRKLLGINGFLARMLLFNLGFVWIRERGRPGGRRDQLEAPTIVANHVAMADIFVTNWLTRGKQTAVAAEWLKRVPLIGGIAKAYHVLHVPAGAGKRSSATKVTAADGSPPAERSRSPSPEGRRSPSPEGGRHEKGAADLIAEYQHLRQGNPKLMPLVIFPEGTTKNERCLVKFRKGAFIGGLPVQPLVLRYPHHFRDISWVQVGPLSNLWKLLTNWVNWVEVEWLDVYKPSEAEREDPDLYASNVQAAIAAAMKLPPERSSRTVDNVMLSAYKRAVLAAKRRPGKVHPQVHGEAPGDGGTPPGKKQPEP